MCAALSYTHPRSDRSLTPSRIIVPLSCTLTHRHRAAKAGLHRPQPRMDVQPIGDVWPALLAAVAAADDGQIQWPHVARYAAARMRGSVARGGESESEELVFSSFYVVCTPDNTRYTPDGASQRGSRVQSPRRSDFSARARRSPHAHLAHHIIVLASSRVLDSTLSVQPLPYTRARARRCPRARAIRSSLSPVNTTRPIFLVFLVVSALLFTRLAVFYILVARL